MVKYYVYEGRFGSIFLFKHETIESAITKAKSIVGKEFEIANLISFDYLQTYLNYAKSKK